MQIYTNNAASELSAPITDSDTTIPLVDGSAFPNPGTDESFWLTLDDGAGTIEIVQCTARSGNSLTVTRAQQGTAAVAWSAGDAAEHRWTAADAARAAAMFGLDTEALTPPPPAATFADNINGPSLVDVSDPTGLVLSSTYTSPTDLGWWHKSLDVPNTTGFVITARVRSLVGAGGFNSFGIGIRFDLAGVKKLFIAQIRTSTVGFPGIISIVRLSDTGVFEAETAVNVDNHDFGSLFWFRITFDSTTFSATGSVVLEVSRDNKNWDPNTNPFSGVNTYGVPDAIGLGQQTIALFTGSINSMLCDSIKAVAL